MKLMKIFTKVLFIVLITLFCVGCSNKTKESDKSNLTGKDVTVFEVIPSDESLSYNVEILQDRKLLEKFEGQKGNFKYENTIEIGHSVTMNAVYQVESKEDITVRISKRGKVLREISKKGGALGTAYIID